MVEIPPDRKDKDEEYLWFMVLAAKQKHAIKKWIGIGFWKENTDIMIKWLYDDTPLLRNSHIEDYLTQHPHFCEVTKKRLLQYDTHV